MAFRSDYQYKLPLERHENLSETNCLIFKNGALIATALHEKLVTKSAFSRVHEKIVYGLRWGKSSPLYSVNRAFKELCVLIRTRISYRVSIIFVAAINSVETKVQNMTENHVCCL